MDPYFLQNLGGSLDSISSSIQSLTGELSSGVRVNAASDDPSAAGQSIALRNSQLVDAQFVTSAGAAESKLQLTDSVLGNVVSQMTQAIALATQGASGTNTQSERQAVATQLSGIRDEVLSLANTSYLGNYIFSGSATAKEPFTLDSSASPATVTYNGDSQTVYQVTPEGESIATGFSGDAIFGSGTGVLSTLNQMISDLSAATLPASATADAQAVSTALTSLSSARVSVDTSLTKMQSASTYASGEQTQLAAEQTSLVGADYVQVSTALKTAETQQTALYSVMASIGQNDLFSYLKG